jgi:GTP-binding protein
MATSGGTPPPPTFVEVAFAGRSNVGKSSLINCMLQRSGLVRTSSTPGCTRQVNLFEAKLRDGARCVMADLPGYGFAQRSKAERNEWAKLIESYLLERVVLKGLVILVDSRRGIEDDDLELVKFAASRKIGGPLPVILVATKIDKLDRSRQASDLAKLKAAVASDNKATVIGFSANTGQGRTELWRSLRRMLSLGGDSAGATGAPHADGARVSPGTENPNTLSGLR